MTRHVGRKLRSVTSDKANLSADHSGRAVFARSNTGIVASSPTGGMDIYVILFCVYVAALRRADLPPKSTTDRV
jgi:hypothetical protein